MCYYVINPSYFYSISFYLPRGTHSFMYFNVTIKKHHLFHSLLLSFLFFFFLSFCSGGEGGSGLRGRGGTGAESEEQHDQPLTTFLSKTGSFLPGVLKKRQQPEGEQEPRREKPKKGPRGGESSKTRVQPKVGFRAGGAEWLPAEEGHKFLQTVAWHNAKCKADVVVSYANPEKSTGYYIVDRVNGVVQTVVRRVSTTTGVVELLSSDAGHLLSAMNHALLEDFSVRSVPLGRELSNEFRDVVRRHGFPRDESCSVQYDSTTTHANLGKLGYLGYWSRQQLTVNTEGCSVLSHIILNKIIRITGSSSVRMKRASNEEETASARLPGFIDCLRQKASMQPDPQGKNQPFQTVPHQFVHLVTGGEKLPAVSRVRRGRAPADVNRMWCPTLSSP